MISIYNAGLLIFRLHFGKKFAIIGVARKKWVSSGEIIKESFMNVDVKGV